MPQQRLLYCDAAQLVALHWRRGRLRAEGRYGHDPAGLAAFGDYLNRHRSSVFRMLVDIAEEGFQFESVPYVRGRDRGALLKRKLNQFFYGSPLTVTLSHGREAGGRRDERMLFAALTRPQLIEPWLAALRAAEAQLAGVYSLPLLAPVLAEQLHWTSEACLLVSLTPAGVRQTYLDRGRLRFSRLSPLAGTDIGEAAGAAATEVARTAQYLTGQRIVVRADALPVLVLARAQQHAAFAAACRDSDDLRFLMLDLAQVERNCGLRDAPPESGSESLFLHLLARQPPSRQFAAAAARRFYRLWQIRYAINASAAAAMLGALLFGAQQVREVRDLRQATHALRMQMQQDEAHYQSILTGLPPMPTSVDNLRAVVERYDAMRARSAGPAAMFRKISRVLDGFPDIELARIDWQLSADAEAGSRGPEAASATAPDGRMLAVAMLSATLPPAQAGEQRRLIETVNGFVAALRRDGQLQANVVQMPVDVESGQTLRGGDGTATAASAPRFTVRIAYPLPVPAS
jgi:hypothetical protein